MNANDLADELDAASSDMEYNYHVSDWKLLSDAAEMLRQQAEQINNLKQWERRYLDVIESLSYDSKQALNPDLRTHDGRLK